MNYSCYFIKQIMPVATLEQALYRVRPSGCHVQRAAAPITRRFSREKHVNVIAHH